MKTREEINIEILEALNSVIVEIETEKEMEERFGLVFGNDERFKGLNVVYKFSFDDGILLGGDFDVELDIKSLSSDMVAYIRNNMSESEREDLDKVLMENGFTL